MDWHSRRITAILENALLEDKATRDATTLATIDPQQRATATVIAKQECVLAGVGCVASIIEVFERLDGTVFGHSEVTSHPDFRRHQAAFRTADRGHPPQCARDPL